MPVSDPVETFVRRARRRCLAAIVIEHGAWGTSAALAALLILLLAGTQVLDWYWLVVAAATGLGVSVWRLRKRIPSEYRAAQVADRNLKSDDAVSTAFYFTAIAPPDHASQELAAAQHRAASGLARTADVRRAVPIHLPRAVYLALSLAVSAGALFGLRYGVTRSLNLRPPLVNLAFDTFRVTPVQEASQRKTPAQRLIDEQLEKMGIPANQQTARTDANDASGNAERPMRAPDGDQTAPRDESASPESAEQGDNTEDAAGQRAAGNDSRDGNAQDRPPSADSPNDRNKPPEENNPLLDKLRDAMANLLAKLKLKPPPGVATRASGSQTAKQTRHTSRGEKGGHGPGEQSAEGAERAGAQAGQPGEGDQQAKAGEGQSSSRAPQRASTQDGKSGIGRQNGDKSLRDAEQLAAMGKLSEILGRRATEVGGEIMVEVKSGKQGLKTQYTQSSATHKDSGGEIHRDEIPLLYQTYVEQYFEQVHKAPAKK
ncbi:MAG: hypothetical protein LLG20_08505 [Acidobacteriales bacterium]|nr:hypothetical protein [Terriglobales bacterium]